MKKLIMIISALIVTTCLTGCLKTDKMENINIATTIYPIEYVTNRLYGDKAKIKSIYPRNSISETYSMTKKQLKDYSEYDLFIYNGATKEREYATKMLNHNKRLKIIDASYGLDTTNTKSDVWLNPSNILMIGQNIKNELSDYITSEYIKSEIETKYTSLKVDVTELETELQKTATNSVSNKIVVADESLNFLKKYGFEVINLTEKGKVKGANLETAKELMIGKKISYIFNMEHTKNNDLINELKATYNITVLEFRTLDTITEKDESNNDDYLSIMHSNIALLQKETYK